MTENIIHRGWCSVHRKIGYPSRKLARQARRGMPWEPGLRAYPCTQVAGSWHVGHLPGPVRAGEITMDEFRDGAR